MNNLIKERLINSFRFMFDESNVEVNPDHLYKGRPGDVIITGPMKSGTTWVENILHQIRTKGDDSFERHHDLIWYIQNPKKPAFDLNADQKWTPRLFKTHQLYGKLQTPYDVKNLFVIRDPYDTAYSFAKFSYRLFGGTDDLDEETTIELLKTAFEHHFDYCHLFQSWWPHRNDSNVFLVFYEDLKKDLKSMISQISSFVGVNLNEAELNHIRELCSFEFMAKNENKFRPTNVLENYRNTIKESKDEWEPNQSIVRKDGGQIGQGRKNIGPKLRGVLDKFWLETMEKSFGYQSYEALYQANTRFQ